MNSYIEGSMIARRIISCNSAPCSAPTSPKSRVKFLCSHGGKILPRPSDGQLKYVGGETRVISIPIDISFQELMKRLTYLIDEEMILRYQLASEDLDALVTVKCDEDLGHMMDEMEHYQMMGYPRMRAFLFPLNHLVLDNPSDQLPLHHRYIFSINGIALAKHRPNPSSASTSPTSPDTDNFNSDTPWLHNPNPQNTKNMPKIHSSPSICNLNLNHYSHQLLSQNYHNPSPASAHQGHSCFKSPNAQPFDTHNHKGYVLDRVVSMRSRGRVDAARLQPDSASPSSYRFAASRDQNQGRSRYCSNCMHHDNCTHLLDRRNVDKQGTLS